MNVQQVKHIGYLYLLCLISLLGSSNGGEYCLPINTDRVHITYTLWIGNDVTQNYFLKMVVPRNISFYEVMQIAARKNTHYQFESVQFSFGHYISVIAGVRENVANNTYWLIYVLNTVPKKSQPPEDDLLSPVGVDGIQILEPKHYLFWYHQDNGQH